MTGSFRAPLDRVADDTCATGFGSAMNSSPIAVDRTRASLEKARGARMRVIAARHGRRANGRFQRWRRDDVTVDENRDGLPEVSGRCLAHLRGCGGIQSHVDPEACGSISSDLLGRGVRAAHGVVAHVPLIGVRRKLAVSGKSPVPSPPPYWSKSTVVCAVT